MYKITLLILAIFICAIDAQSKIDESIIEDGKVLLGDLKSPVAYKKFVAHYKSMPDADTIQKMISIGIIGARLFKLEREYNFFVKQLQEKYPKSSYIEIVHLKNLSDQCQTCKGKGTSAKKCIKCKGNGACSNSRCSDGEVTDFDRVNGKFVKIQRQCAICKGKGSCSDCTGSGESMGVCTKCRKSGYVYSATKALKVYEDLIKEIVNSSAVEEEPAKATAVVSEEKQMVNEVEEEVSAPDLLGTDIKKKVEVNPNETKKQVVKSKEASEINVDETISRLKTFLKDYPDHDRASEVKKELEYYDLYKEALNLEQKGAYSKAIKKYREVLKIKNTEDVILKIERLDYQTIGL